LKKLSKAEFIKQMSTVRKEDKKIIHKWGTKAQTKAIRW